MKRLLTIWIIVKEIGEDRINDIARRIEARANQISSECLETIKSGDQWIQSLKLKPDKMKNQTCFMMTKDMGPYIHEDQVTRWKQQYPKWRMSDKDLANMKFKGSQTPDFCSKDSKTHILGENFLFIYRIRRVPDKTREKLPRIFEVANKWVWHSTDSSWLSGRISEANWGW